VRRVLNRYRIDSDYVAAREFAGSPTARLGAAEPAGAILSPPGAGKAEADWLHHSLVRDEWYLLVRDEWYLPVVTERRRSSRGISA
jgi:hypothetical protein